MGAYVEMPDALDVVANYLRPALAAHGQAAEVQTGKVSDPRPDLLVHLRRTGGIQPTPVTDAPQISFECWGLTEADAHDLAACARACLHAMAHTTQGGVAVGKVEDLGGPAELPDFYSQTPRYTFAVVAHLRGTPG